VRRSPDGRRLATGSFDNTARVLYAETGKELLTLRSSPGEVLRGPVAWSPGGKRLATGSRCNTTKVWDTESGKELLALRGLQTTVRGCQGEAFRRTPEAAVTLGIEITLPDRTLFYLPAVGDGEMVGIIPSSEGRFAGIRITPRMRGNSVEIEVSALVRSKKKLSEATYDDVRFWHSEQASSYQGNRDAKLLLSGLDRLGLPVFSVKVVQGRGPLPRPPSAANSFGCATCGCRYPEPRSGIFGGNIASRVGAFCSSPEPGKCVEVT